jgi:membrane protease YdiL (CAAX protease family)
MTPAAALWLRLALVATLCLTLWLALAPPQPRQRLTEAMGALAGGTAGVLLFAAVTRRSARLPAWPTRVWFPLARLGVLALWATGEEIVWRHVALGHLLRLGALPAIAASSAGFAFMHRRRLLHFGTGVVFGALYVASGVLITSVAAHSTYNALLVAMVAADQRDHARPP